MKRSLLILSAVAVLGAAATLVGCSSEPSGTAGDPDEQFINEVRREAASTPASAEGPGRITPEGAAAPAVELQTRTFEMGEIDNTGITVKRMKVYNRGDAPLKISRITTSCGCTTGEMEQNLIPAGGEANLIIRVDPTRVAGFYANKVLTLFTNDPRNPTPRVNVISHIKPEVAITPDAFNFGQISTGNEVEMTIRVRQLQDAPFEINDVTPAKALPYIETAFEKRPESEWDNPGKAEYDVTARILSNAPAGVIEDWIWLRSNVARSPNIPVKLEANLVGPYTLAPKAVTVRGVTPGQAEEGVLVLSSGDPVKITSVSNSNGAVDVTYREAEKPNTYFFDVNVPDRTPSRGIRDTWTIAFTVDGKEFKESIPVAIVLTSDE